MQGKSALMAGAAAVALVMSAQAGLAGKGASEGGSNSSSSQATSGPSNAELAARIQALEDQLQASELKVDNDHSRLSSLEQNFNDTVLTFSNGRPIVTSGDKRFSMIFRVRFQSDFGAFMQDDPTAAGNQAQYKDLGTGMVVRRAHLGVQGIAFKDFWYEFRYNMGGSDAEAAGLSLARVAYTGIPNFRINVGVIEPAFMHEGTTSSSQLMFMERPEIDNIAADVFGAGDARRGIELVWQKAGLFKPDDNLVLMTALTGSATGSATGHANGGDEQSQILGRLSYRFWNDGASNAMFGVSAGHVLNSAGQGIRFRDRPQIRINGDRLIDANFAAAKRATMYAFDGGININNFFLGGEYANFMPDVPGTSDDPEFHGWYVEGSWILTGETKGYTVSALNNEVGGWSGPKVANPFSLAGDSWGAWEVVARYSDTNLDWHRLSASGTRGGKERIINLGINWYLNNQVRLGLYDQIVKVDKLNASYAQIGQDINVIGARLQFTN